MLAFLSLGSCIDYLANTLCPPGAAFALPLIRIPAVRDSIAVFPISGTDPLSLPRKKSLSRSSFPFSLLDCRFFLELDPRLSARMPNGDFLLQRDRQPNGDTRNHTNPKKGASLARKYVHSRVSERPASNVSIFVLQDVP